MTEEKKALNWCQSVLSRVFRPKPKMPIWRWLEKNCEIPLITGTPTPGPFRIHRAPLMKRWFEAYEDPTVRFISFAKSARVGGTLFGILCHLWVVANKPGPILWVYPTTQNAKDDSQKDFHPIFEACKATDDIRSKTKEGWTRLFMFFRDSYVKLIGSNSTAALAGVQARDLSINEADKLTDNPGKEAPPAELALTRTIMFKDRKVFRNSTPTGPLNAAWQYFLTGSREYAYLPCPRCDHMQRLTFFPEDRIGSDGEPIRDESGQTLQTGQVVFKHCKDEHGEYDKERVEQETYYECEECKGRIEHNELNAMCLDERTEWRSHNPKAPADQKSGHITTLYSFFFSWGWIANEWLRSKDTPGGRQGFYNSILGLPFEHAKTTITEKTIRNVIKTCPQKFQRIFPGSGRELPRKPELICMQSDVQGESTGMWWTIFMWDSDWNMWLLDWSSTEARGFSDLDVVADRVFLFEGEAFPVSVVGIDSNYRTPQVQDWCEQAQNRYPMNGRDMGKNGGMFRPIQEQPIDGRDLTLVQFIDSYFKAELYHKRIAARAGRGFYLPEWESKDGLEDGVDKQLLLQLTNERMNPISGLWEGQTAKRADWNHLGDCCKMAVVQDHVFDVQRKLEAAEREQAAAEAKRLQAANLTATRGRK